MKTNKNQWQDDAALKRYTMIAPLLDSSIDNARRVALRKKIAEDNNTTIRSLYRYEKAYRKDGFAGLRPSNREKQRSQALPDNFQELLSEAVQLRREVPERSVEQIILILELENRVAPGVLRRSTLERHLFDAGFGAEHMRAYKTGPGKFFQTVLQAAPDDASAGRYKIRAVSSHREKRSKCKNLFVLRNR